MAHVDQIRSPKLPRGILISVIGVLTLSFTLAVGLLLRIADEQDGREVARASDLILSALDARTEQVARTTSDYSAWGAAYSHLHANFDLTWAYTRENVGPTLFDSFGLEYVILIDPTGREIYSVDRGTLSAAPISPRFGAGFADLVAEARTAPAGESFAARRILVSEGTLALAAAAVVSPGSDESVAFLPGPQSVLVFLDLLTAAEIKEMGEGVHVQNLQISAAETPDEPSWRSLVTADGNRFGFRWNPEQPGQKMATAVLPGLVIAGIALTIVLVALVRYGLASAEAVSRTRADLVAANSKAEHQALHDATTGLPNRLKLASHLEERLLAGLPAAVLFLDLDRFKPINDSLGHAAGDEVLRTVARRLVAAAGGALVARVGGDEFVIVAPTNEARVLDSICADLIASVSAPIALDSNTVEVGLSVGVAVFPGDALAASELLRLADIALYEAKKGGRGSFRFFSTDMNERILQRRALERDLRKALLRSEFLLHYQPRVDARTLNVRSIEALIRWRRPDGAIVAPSTFIPVAEETGLIVPIGAWVLSQACMTAARLSIAVSVNVSPIQFRAEGFVQTVADTLTATGLPADRLELEITEGVLLEDTERAMTILDALKRLGVRLAMDDFGTGYSSLGYLRSFPFDAIKIDRRFIADLKTSGDARAIVQAVLGLGRALGMRVTAEGVETLEQLMLLRNDQCEEVQGFFTGRPMPEQDLPGLLDSIVDATAQTSNPEHRALG